MDIQAIDSSRAGNLINSNNLAEASQPAQPTPPTAGNVHAFDQLMKSNAASGTDSTTHQHKDNLSGNNAGIDNSQLKDLLMQILKLVQEMLGQVSNESGSGKTSGGSTAGPGESVKPVSGNGPGGSAENGSNKIPEPTEHLQQLNLGGKAVTVGGDGSSSAEEVAATAQSIEHMYQNSPTFKNMIDNSADPSFDVSVGRRDDNTSWGNSEGRVFMNINNIAPGNNDSFQGLLAHEFAHASIDIGHGAQMEQIQDAAAKEA
ncbi:MAG: hypothetical protein ACPGVP_14200 [Thiolinea sp.]